MFFDEINNNNNNNNKPFHQPRLLHEFGVTFSELKVISFRCDKLMKYSVTQMSQQPFVSTSNGLVNCLSLWVAVEPRLSTHSEECSQKLDFVLAC